MEAFISLQSKLSKSKSNHRICKPYRENKSTNVSNSGLGLVKIIFNQETGDRMVFHLVNILNAQNHSV